MSKNRKLFLVLLQVVLWSAFIALPYFMTPRFNDAPNTDMFLRLHSQLPDATQNIFLSTLALNFCLLVFFYAHHYFLFDRFIVRKRFGVYFTLVIIIFIAIFSISHFYKRILFPSLYIERSALSFREIIRASTWYMLVLLVSLGLKLLAQWRQAEQRASEIENEQLRTELSFLHAQINPHFLFNSLNTIYSLSLKKSDVAPHAILKLSQLLRYVIDEATRDSVPLSREVEYLNNYIELQKLRSAPTVKVNFKTTGNLEQVVIAPLLLLPFVENAFKYGISNHEESPIDIFLMVDSVQISFTVKNKKFEYYEKHSTGIGIPNVQRRLALLYPEKHNLKIEDSDDFYLITLTIYLK